MAHKATKVHKVKLVHREIKVQLARKAIKGIKGSKGTPAHKELKD
jgi:hypothetical protein